MSDNQTGETELIGRTELGRFGPGNQCSAGRSSLAAELRKAFTEAVTSDDIAAIARSLVKLAVDGDVAASKLVLDRVCGKPDGMPSIAIQNNVTSGTGHDREKVAAIMEQLKSERASRSAEVAERQKVLPQALR